ncbi:PREDICTED: uncharacterized protein LOC109583005 [Amphimedon queenslandica]|uniref:Uncharacterized protein n=1 Tax=Amphimedon queenslandica TaxID=400682 RepID=A0A1X7UKS3_AMPQE|nr:PREDICTED: uncharacterized protein LOC109583005 [Amphimedon queenslandica]|eukprot:XP_019853686.1 PREDICTED: uncharacterized protein LOC109583005 [Amphimedon queenslandica]
MSSYEEEAKQDTQQFVTGLLNTEGLPTVFDKCLSISRIEDKLKSLKEQIEECLKDTAHKELKAQMLDRLEAIERDLTTVTTHVKEAQKEAKENNEKCQKQIKELQSIVAEQQKVINELVNEVRKENLPPIGTLPESTPQQKSTPSNVHDDSGYLSAHSIRSKPTVSGEQELKIKLDYPDEDSIAPSTH